mgnify:CR=1 FL=1
MSDTEYGAALKLGKKQYQDAVAKGEYPYLPVLDDVLSYTDIVSTVSLGTMDIPLAKLVGTVQFLCQQLYASFAGTV